MRHYRLLLWNCWMKFNETWQEARTQGPLPSFCFCNRLKNKMTTVASHWLKNFDFPSETAERNFNKTWQEARSLRPLTSLCFFGPISKIRCLPRLLIGWDIFEFSPETAEWNSTKLDRKQGLKVLRWTLCGPLCNLYMKSVYHWYQISAAYKWNITVGWPWTTRPDNTLNLR